MQVIRKKVGQPAELVQIEGDLASIQEEVGGYFTHVPLFDSLVLLCNDDGLPLGLRPNFPVQGLGVIVGDVLFVREQKENYVDVTKEDLRKLADCIGFMEMGFPLDC